MRAADRAVYVVLTAMCIALTVGAAQSMAQQTLDARTGEVSLFKNGLAFVLREVNVPDAGEFVVENLPAPVHGSFWIIPDAKETELQQAIAFSKPRTETSDALTIIDLAKANVGNEVSVKVGEDEWIPATIVSVPEEEPKLPVSLGDGRGYGRSYPRPGRAYRPPSLEEIRQRQSGTIVLLRTAQGMMAMNAGQILAIRGSEDEFATSVTRSEPGAALRLQVAGEAGVVRIASLQWGLTWAPSYMVDITDSDECSIRCKAEVINDAEDLEDATLQFVTGFPNLAFAEVVSPMALVGDVTDFIQSLLNLGSGRERDSHVMMQQAVMSNVAFYEAPPGPMAPPASTPGQGEFREDLFLYPQPNVTLARGQRAYCPVFAKTVPYEHLYQWAIEDSVDQRGYWRYDRAEDGPGQEEVWHVVRIENAGGIPWTTAPAMTVQEGRIIGQDTLYFTNPSDKTILKLTRSVDIMAAEVEHEIERQVDAVRRHGQHCDLITVEGELRVHNHKAKPVTMLIEKTLTGEVLETDHDPKIETLTDNIWLDNPRQKLTWEVPLEAKGELEITYRFKVYVVR